MLALGFAIKKGELWYAIVEGTTMSNAKLVKSDKQLFNVNQTNADLMLDFYNLFSETITVCRPDKIAYKIHLQSDLDQLPYMQFSLGVLNLICKTKNIPSFGRSGSWITASKNKKTIACKEYFGMQNLAAEKLASILIAWYLFEA